MAIVTPHEEYAAGVQGREFRYKNMDMTANWETPVWSYEGMHCLFSWKRDVGVAGGTPQMECYLKVGGDDFQLTGTSTIALLNGGSTKFPMNTTLATFAAGLVAPFPNELPYVKQLLPAPVQFKWVANGATAGQYDFSFKFFSTVTR